MADRIKGITVEIGGDTTKLNKALSGVNREIRNTQSALKDVNSLLKVNPGNTELLRQKQERLNEAIKATEDKLKVEKEALEQLKSADPTPENKANQQALAREIIATENELKNLKKESSDFGSVFKQQIKAAGEAVSEMGGKLKEVGSSITEVGKHMSVASAAIMGLGASVVKTAANFDTSMSKVQALSGATSEQLDALSAKAQEMGKSTKFSAAESADAFSYMALAGWDVDSMLEGINPVLNLATAAEMDLAEASDIVTDYLTAFGLTASDAEKFTDQLAYAMANSNTDVTMLGEAYKNCAATAASMGYSVEDTTAVLMTMANAGVKGGEAGSGLSAIMTRLATDAKGCASELGKYGVEIYDAEGNMNSLSSILEGMSGVWSTLTDEEQANLAKTIAGTNQYSKLQTIMAGLSDSAKEGGMSFTDYAKALGDCDGAASEMAAVMQDNLEGQMTTLKSSLEGLAITFGEMLMPYIQKAVDFIQKIVDKLNAMDESQRNAILVIGLIVAAIGPLLIVIGNLITAVGTIMTVLPVLMGPVGIVIAAVAAAIAIGVALYKNWDTICAKASEIKENIVNAFTSIKDNVVGAVTSIKDNAVEKFESIKAGAAEKFSQVQSTISSAVDGAKQAAAEKLGNIKTAFEENGGGIKGVVAAGWTAIKEYYGTGFSILNKLTGGKLGEIKNAFTKTFKSLASSALKWGKDIIQNMIDGITAMIDKLKNAAGNIADTIASYIHFSEPDVGPLSRFHTFMPDMVDLMVNGINKSISKIDAPMNDLATALIPRTQDKYDSLIAASNFNSEYSFDRLEHLLGGLVNKETESSDVRIYLEGDAKEIFKIVREENTKFYKSTGRSAF